MKLSAGRHGTAVLGTGLAFLIVLLLAVPALNIPAVQA